MCSGNTGLQSLSRELLGLEMDKAFHVQCGDWEAEQLSERQVGGWERWGHWCCWFSLPGVCGGGGGGGGVDPFPCTLVPYSN